MRPLSAGVAVVVLAVILYNATVVDRVAPQVTIRLSATAPDSNLALTLSSVDVVFNEDVDQKTAERAFSITPEIKGTFYWQGQQTLIFTPSQKLPLSSTFHVHVAPGVQDKAGNVQSQGSDLTFTTVGNPVVKSVSPVQGAGSVPLDSSITITFDRMMDTQKVLDGLTLDPTIPFEQAWSGQVLTLEPTGPLAPSTTYIVRLGGAAADGDGNPLDPYQWSFKTVALGLNARSLVPAPEVQGVSVRTPIAIIFDGPIDKASIADALTLTPAVAGTIEVRSLAVDNGPAAQQDPARIPFQDSVLILTPDQPLKPNTTYKVTLGAGVRSADGQAASARSWSFATGQPVDNVIGRIMFLSDRSGVGNVWTMNPDGSGQRQITVELSPVVAFDVNTAGDRIAYSTAGRVKRMHINGEGLQSTAVGLREYAPAFSADGTGLVVARRGADGGDLGYHRIPLITGSDERQILADGAPQPGSSQVGEGGLVSAAGLPAWGVREAFSDDSAWMLVARADGNALELVEMEGDGRVEIGLAARARPVWNVLDKAFYVVASDDRGTTWGCWRITTDAVKTRVGAASGGAAASSKGALAYVMAGSDGVDHLYLEATPWTPTSGRKITLDAAWNERWPSFSPDGSQIVFSRVSAQTPTQSGGIWIMRPDDPTPTVLSPDGIWPRFVP